MFDIVPFENQNTISSRWVITHKVKDGNRIVKARLVARGFEEDSSKLQKDSPTCCKESLHLLFAICSSFGWILNSLDISAAFLQGDSLERDVFLKPPKDVCPPHEV